MEGPEDAGLLTAEAVLAMFLAAVFIVILVVALVDLAGR
jgi:hypothetical protein